jgi:single-stranded-DNA-specific exonuclease
MGNTEQIAQQWHWQLKPRTQSDIIDQLLKNRGIVDREQFFAPDYERHSHDPLLLPGMTEALDRIERAIKNRELICVFGDYDADGIPATAVLIKTLRANDAIVKSYIPDREREGYGLNEVAIKSLKGQGVDLIITVDLGITGRAEVALAKELGIDVIVTDHHHVDEERVPVDAIAVVHPALPGSKYPFAGLAGGGVAWKLCQALSVRTGKPNQAELKWLLELPAISTVCDMVPLVDENRMLVHYGLKVLMQTRNIGLQALYRVGGIPIEALTERTIGYQIGPRINAPGRIDQASLALELLLTDDLAVAQELAAKTEGQNRERQEQLDGLVKAVIEVVEREKLHEAPAIVLAGEGWPTGVIGLAASRLTERYHRPSIVLGIQNGVAKGSGRSISGFNLLAGIADCHDLLTTYGGHDKAVGLQMDIKNFPAFKERFLNYASTNITPELLVPAKKADLELDPMAITEEFVQTLTQFAPFGIGNSKPKFVVSPLEVIEVRPVGAAKQHLKLRFKGGLEAIGFSCAQHTDRCKVGNQVAALGSLEFNSWNGRQTIQLLIDDIKSIEEYEQNGVVVKVLSS